MQQLMLFYDRELDAQHRRKVLKSMIKERVDNDKRCQELLETVKWAKANLKNAIEVIMDEYKKEREDIELLTEEIKMEKDNVAEEAIQLLLKGELENIKRGDNEYRPKFSVKWVKVDSTEQEKGKMLAKTINKLSLDGQVYKPINL